jgi:Tfp pilus assembly protein PilZ
MTTSLLMSKISNITSIAGFRGGARQSPTPARPARSQHQRSESRHASNERLFIQVVDSSDPDLIGRTLSCYTFETSANGLRLATDTRIPITSRLDLWVNISTRPGKFFLAGEVRWVREEAGADFLVGVELQPGTATDIEAWREIHNQHN